MRVKKYLKLLLFFLVVLLAIIFLLRLHKEKPMKMNNPHNIHGVISYQRSFNDLNETQLEAAKRWGIRPIESREEVKKWGKKLVEIKSCDAYVVDSLTHSIPYLVPRAAELLKKIGENFQDSLANKGLNPNQIIVTSVLRTQSDQKRLRTGNRNATENSAHAYATTFDISHKRFHKLEDPKGYPTEDVNPVHMKMVLSEVLRDLRKADKCLVKYELKQGCFHITVK